MRFHPRIKTDIPAKIYAELKQSEAKITDLSIGGALLRRNFPETYAIDFDHKPVLIQYILPRIGSFEQSGNITREDNSGLVVSFNDLDSDSKIKLWQYIADNLKDLHNCPYCGEKFDIAPSVCGVCGWKLTFDAPEYFEYYEKTHLLKKLYQMADSLGKDQIKKLANFVEAAFNNNFIKSVDLGLNAEFFRQDSSLKELKEQMEKQKVKQILEVHGNNISKAAKILGISRPTLYNFKKKYNL